MRTLESGRVDESSRARVVRRSVVRTRDVFISRAAVRCESHDVGIRDLQLFLSFSLLPLSFSPYPSSSSFRFTHLHPWLLLTYFSPSPSADELIAICALRCTRASTRTVTHALSRTHAADIHAIHQGASSASRARDRAKTERSRRRKILRERARSLPARD